MQKLAWGTPHPGHLVYLIDLSGSMEEHNKVQDVMSVVFERLENLGARCTVMASIKERFSLTVIGYNSEVIPLFKGGVEQVDELLSMRYGQPLFDINGVAKPQWQTYMADAFDAAREDVEQWIKDQRAKGMPVPVPIVINITDGHPEEYQRTEAQSTERALEAAQRLMQVRADDSNTLLFNIHYEPASGTAELILPKTEPADTRRRFLYNASSVLNADDVNVARAKGLEQAVPGCHGMVSNAQDKKLLLNFVEMASSLGTGEKPKTE